MEFNTEERGDVVVMAIEGKLLGGPEETAILDGIGALAEAGKTKVVLDLTNLQWMNSRGLGICVSGLTTLRRRGGDLRPACLSDKVQQLISQCHLDRVFFCYKTVEEAVDSFK
jgi:anti-sigma B factor antagonist